MTLKYSNPEGMAKPVGNYTHGVEIPEGHRVLYTAGQVGLAPDGTLPRDLAQQAENVWYNLKLIVQANRMTMNDVVKINHYVVGAENVQAYREIFARHLGTFTRPASTLVVVSALAKPEFLVEVELVAAAE